MLYNGMNTFGEQLLAWRRRRGLTQTELAARAGIPQPNLSALESDRWDPKLSTIRRLAAALQIAPGQLMDQRPRERSWDRHHIDRFVRQSVLDPAKVPPQDSRMAWALHQIAHGRLEAAGKQKRRPSATGERVIKQLKADLGPQLWNAVMARLDKHL